MLRDQLAPLTAELAVWRDDGLTLPLWWRDDDAVTLTPALERLLSLASSFDAPIHLAVIPGVAEEALVQRVEAAENVFAIPHGWRHENHAPPGEKKAEFGAHRPASVMLAEVERGWRRMEALFGPGALPIFVPPWNRICPAVVSGLASRGLSAVSVFLPRQDAFAAPGVLQVNTHLDPICWRRGGRPAEPGKLATLVLDHLRSRRKAHVDNIEPYGLLTHHLASDTATWDFVATLVDVLVSSGVARWTSPLDAH